MNDQALIHLLPTKPNFKDSQPINQHALPNDPRKRVVELGEYKKKGSGIPRNKFSPIGRKNWKKRLFVLEEGKLSYYDPSDMSTPKGEVRDISFMKKGKEE